MRRTPLAWIGAVLLGALFCFGPGVPRATADEGAQPQNEAELGILRARLDALLAEARILEAKGELDAALEVYRSVTDVYTKVMQDLQRLRKPTPMFVIRQGRGERVGPAALPVDGRRPSVPRVSRFAGSWPESNDLFGVESRCLRWLAAHQGMDGSWHPQKHIGWIDGVWRGIAQPDGAGDARRTVGVTGLALQAFLAAGHQPGLGGSFRGVIRKGLQFLMDSQDQEGCFGLRSHTAFVYDHAAATLALVTASARNLEDRRYRRSAQKALDFIAAARNPYSAWRYGVRTGQNDTSVTGWMMLPVLVAETANRNAQAAGFDMPFHLDSGMRQGAEAWVERMTDADTARVGHIEMGGRPGRPLFDGEVQFPAEFAEGPTAIGLILTATSPREDKDDGLMARQRALLAKTLPQWDIERGTIDMEYWRFGALAARQEGGALLERWTKAFLETAANQRREGRVGRLRGSFDPVGVWGSAGGRVYSTAMMSIASSTLRGRGLEVFPKALLSVPR